MKPGSVLDVQLVDVQGKPLAMPNVSIDVVLYIGGRERYRFDAGDTDEQGRLSTSYDRLELARKKNQGFALMDYNTRLEDCEDVVGLEFPRPTELHDRLTAAQKWFPKTEPKLAERIKNSNNQRVAAAGIKKVSTNGSRMVVLLSAH